MFLTIKFASCLPKLILSGIFYCVISWQLQAKLYQHSKKLFLGNLTSSSCCLIRVPESLDSLLQKELVSFIVGSQDLYSYGFLKQTTLKVDWVASIGKWYKIHNIYIYHMGSIIMMMEISHCKANKCKFVGRPGCCHSIQSHDFGWLQCWLSCVSWVTNSLFIQLHFLPVCLVIWIKYSQDCCSGQGDGWGALIAELVNSIEVI